MPEITRKRPNILLVVVEQHQARALQPGSPCRLPNLRLLESRGVRFTRYHAPNAICSPSRASLFTGLYPSRHGMVDCTHTVEPYRAKFDASRPLWTQRLRQLGYRGGCFGKWHVERSEQLGRFGFSKYLPAGSEQYREYRRQIRLSPRVSMEDSFYLKQPGYRDALLYGVTPEPAEASEVSFLFAEAMRFIRECGDKPWFAIISPRETHDPFVAPRQYYKEYSPQDLPLPTSYRDPLTDKPAIQRRLRTVWESVTPERARQAIACYLANCTLIDDLMGRMMRMLSDLGQLDDTIIIYTADHGELLGAHGLFLKGVPAYEEAYNIPFVIAGPGIKGGRESAALAGHVDLAPTIIDLTGGQPLEDIDGRSFYPLLMGQEEQGWDEGYAEFHGQRFFYTQRIVWSERYKYIFNGFDFDELYDLQEDPAELRNLAADPAYRRVATEMAARMWERVKALGDHNMLRAQYPMFRFAPVGPEG